MFARVVRVLAVPRRLGGAGERDLSTVLKQLFAKFQIGGTGTLFSPLTVSAACLRPHGILRRLLTLEKGKNFRAASRRPELEGSASARRWVSPGRPGVCFGQGPAGPSEQRGSASPRRAAVTPFGLTSFPRRGSYTVTASCAPT